MKFKNTIVIIVLLMSTNLIAQTTDNPGKGALKLETNLGFWAVGGQSLNAFYVTPKRWTFGLQLVGNLELPDFARDQFFDNADDLTIDWDFAVGAEIRYRFKDSPINEGFYALSGLGYEGWTTSVTDDGTVPTDEFQNWYFTLGIGYNWYPFQKKNFHVGASYNLIFLLNNTDDRTIGDDTYNLNRVVPPSFLPSAIYVAWTFN